MYRFVIILFLSMTTCFAAQEFYQFQSKNQQQNFELLTNQLRCLVCQNQNLAESNAPLAEDLRDQIYQKIIKGESNQQVIEYLVDRYGTFILYRPAFNSYNLILWFGPFIILFSGISYLLYSIRRTKAQP